MPTRDRLRVLALSCIVSALPSLAVACGTEEPAGAARLRAERPKLPTTGELTSYLEWYRDWKHLVNRHRGEGEAAVLLAAAKYPSDSYAKVATDPAFIADHERRAAEQQAHYAREPKGLTAAALKATIQGIGRMVIRPDGMVYEAGRDEAALAAARAKYGEKFVDWVLAHETVINETLAQ